MPQMLSDDEGRRLDPGGSPKVASTKVGRRLTNGETAMEVSSVKKFSKRRKIFFNLRSS